MLTFILSSGKLCSWKSQIFWHVEYFRGSSFQIKIVIGKSQKEMGSQKNHSRRMKHKFYGNQSVRPKKLKVNIQGDNSCLRLRKLKKSFEESTDYDIINFEIISFSVNLLYVQNVYQRTLNLEMVCHVVWVMLIKSTLLEETVVIKNPHIHQSNHRKCQKVKDVENLILT